MFVPLIVAEHRPPGAHRPFGAAIGKHFTKDGKPPTWRGLAPLGAMAMALAQRDGVGAANRRRQAAKGPQSM
jgi:hypothetical protein